MIPERYVRSMVLMERARQVIPGGVWGHVLYPAALDHGAYPYFFERARGAYFYDPDGNRYIDYLCSYGAMINGYAHPEVDEAARREGARGTCLNLPSERSVELAELLCRTIRGATWCTFGKNGSDATSMALLVARAHTGRRRVVGVRRTFHSSHLWGGFAFADPGPGRSAEDFDFVSLIDWNDTGALERVFAEHGRAIAAVLISPYHHPYQGRAELPSASFLACIQELTRRHGALFIMDDVRAGFRLDMAGSHVHFGCEPDLICIAKALANTHPLSALLGRSEVRAAAASVFMSGTYWPEAPPLAAALANLRLLRSVDGVGRMMRLGQRLTDGLVSLGEAIGIGVEVTGPVCMPTVTIRDDPDYVQMRRFACEMVARGSFVHPLHNWFVSIAHTDADIEETLEHAGQALRALRDAGPENP